MAQKRSMGEITLALVNFSGSILLVFLLVALAFPPISRNVSSSPGSASLLATDNSDKQIGPSSNRAPHFVLNAKSRGHQSSVLHRIAAVRFCSGLQTLSSFSNETATTTSVSERRFSQPPTRAPPLV